MAFYNQSEKMYNNCHDKSKSKVYINPNFNRPAVSSHPHNVVMHVNPRFPYLIPSVQSSLKNTRIHVNPYFMKSKSAHEENEQIAITNIDCTQQKAVILESSLISSHRQATIENQRQTKYVPITKTRFSLVRQNAPKPLEVPVLDKPKTTFQVSKYKSIPLNDIKRNLDSAKNALTKYPPIRCHNKTNSTPITNASKNHFKLVNQNNGAVLRNHKIKTRTLIVPSNKKILLNRSRLKKVRVSLKKNNIPCPTFRKFGKCLRKIRGKCEFVHDKKHVSICRKFIKGLCHDKDCLLSHDLTTKKMPTCYFYLQGTCTKPGCPYLHVKLNEKVRICPDFLKGYCEKGGKCLLRHIYTERKAQDSVELKTSLALKKKYRKFKVKHSDLVNARATQSNDENSVLTEKSENYLDGRYYQENKSELNATETCQMLKPIRCKLGTLPSFIQL